MDPVGERLREQARLVVSPRADSTASGRYRRNQVPPGLQFSGNGGLGHTLTHEHRQTAPAIIFQAMHESVRRRPQDDCEARGRKLRGPTGTFEASVGRWNPRSDRKSASATGRPRRGAKPGPARTTDQLSRTLQWNMVSATDTNRRQKEIQELDGQRPAVHAPAAVFTRPAAASTRPLRRHAPA